MATVSYIIRNVVQEFDATYSAVQDRASDETQPKVVALADGGFAVTYLWYALDEDMNAVLVEFYNADGSRRFGDDSTNVRAAVTGTNIYDLSATQLANGALVVSWSDTDNPGIHYASVDPNSGRVLDEDTKLPSTVAVDYYGDVAALPGGGFALVRQNTSSSTDLDADLLIYNNAGVLQGGVHALNDNKSTDELNPAVAVLTAGVNKGAIVASYSAEQPDGSGRYGMSVEIWNAAGQRILSPFAFDTAGDRNFQSEIVALNDGGFAVAYLDNEYGNASDMSIAFFDQNGSFRGKLRADIDKIADGEIALTVLPNGYVLLTHTDKNSSSTSYDVRASLFDPVSLTRLSAYMAIEVQSGLQSYSSVATLKNGNFVTAWTDYNTAIEDGNVDPDDQHVSIQIDTIVRVTVGDIGIDTLTGDALIDQMHGGGSADTLKGMGGNDTLFGDGGADMLDGGTGADRMEGGADSDTFIVDNAKDVVIELANGGLSDRVMARLSYTLAAGTEVELLTTTSSTGTTSINLTGNEFAQSLTGNAGKNTLNGKAGADKMSGLGGNDTYYVDNTKDIIVEAKGKGTDKVATSVSYTLGAGVEVEAMVTTSSAGKTSIRLTGNEFAQSLTGNAGANTLNGKGGNDILKGGLGKDVFLFDTKLGSTNIDTIDDFIAKDDTIRLDDDIFTKAGKIGDLSSGAFYAGTKAHDTSDRIIYDKATGKLWYDADGSGTGTAVQFALLDKGLTLTAADFDIIA